MPRYTERPDIPDLILKALRDDSYSKALRAYRNGLSEGDRRLYDTLNISVTSLTQPPRVRQLNTRYDHLMEVDPMENIFKLYGNVVHTLMETYANPTDLVERRLGVWFNGVWVHGQADLVEVDRRRITDYKVTKTASFLYDHPEYEAQLNLLRFIFRSHGYECDSLRNIYLYRDWTPKYANDETKYPKEPMMESIIPVWSDDQVEAYLTERTSAHREAAYTKDNDLPYCSPHERWERPAEYFVYKIDERTGEPMARKRFSSLEESEAKSYLAETQADDLAKALADNAARKRSRKPEHEVMASVPQYIITKRPGVPARCMICQASSWCNQRINEIETNSGHLKE